VQRPRDWLEDSADFGVAEEVQLRDGDPVARAHARLCHETVRAVRSAAHDRNWDMNDIADRLAVNRRYLQRKLSGHLPVTIHDLACWSELLGLSVTVA
jgi:hypothetical protein